MFLDLGTGVFLYVATSFLDKARVPRNFLIITQQAEFGKPNTLATSVRERHSAGRGGHEGRRHSSACRNPEFCYAPLSPFQT